MRISFYIKLFVAFIIFAILLLGFASFAFNNFYKSHNQKKEISDITNILKYQEDSFKNYVKSFDEKLFLLGQNYFLEEKNEKKLLDLLQKVLFSDKNILEGTSKN